MSQLFVDSYNKRKPDNQLDVAECHLEAGAGSEQALGKGDTIGATITDRADVYVRPGATEEGLGAAASAAAAAAAANAAAAAEAASKTGENIPLLLVLLLCVRATAVNGAWQQCGGGRGKPHAEAGWGLEFSSAPAGFVCAIVCRDTSVVSAGL